MPEFFLVAAFRARTRRSLSRDFVVDREGLEETAAWFDGELRVVDGLAHDVMLDAEWRVAADAIDDWLERNNL